MRANPSRGDVWLADLGLVAKTRPVLVLSVTPDDLTDRDLRTVIPHTTSTRGGRFEVVVPVPFLKSGAFDTQNVLTIPTPKLIRRLGVLRADQLQEVEVRLRMWLGLVT